MWNQQRRQQRRRRRRSSSRRRVSRGAGSRRTQQTQAADAPRTSRSSLLAPPLIPPLTPHRQVDTLTDSVPEAVAMLADTALAPKFLPVRVREARRLRLPRHTAERHCRGLLRPARVEISAGCWSLSWTLSGPARTSDAAGRCSALAARCAGWLLGGWLQDDRCELVMDRVALAGRWAGWWG